MSNQPKPGVPQLFFDDSLIAFQRRLQRRWMPASVWHEPVLSPERPWEGRALAYGAVLPDPEGGYRLYYNGYVPTGANCFSQTSLFMARSTDGFRWERPELGIHEINGSRDNNAVIVSDGWHLDGTSVLYDPDDAKAPWKHLCYRADREGKDWGFHVYTSLDGLHWNLVPGRRVHAADRNNMAAAKVNGKYVNYTRLWEMYDKFRGRVIYRSQSEDFINWTHPEIVLVPDLEDAPDIEFYGLNSFEYHGWHIGMLEYWDSLNDCIETHAVLSRDTRTWMRTSRKPFIAATYDWNRCWSICTNNAPIIMNEQMIFYFNGRRTAHHWNSVEQHGVIGYASLPLDRFCAIEGTSGGVLETIPLTWPGGELVLNADTRGEFDRHPLPMQHSGQIEIEILDAEGNALPDWSGENRVIWVGNTHCRGAINNMGTVKWPGDRKLDSLRGQTIRLRFCIKHARLFTFVAQAT